METKKVVYFIIVLLIFLSSFFYMRSKYSHTGAELRINSPIDHEEFLLLRDNSIVRYTINYIIHQNSQYNDKIIMTTGGDMHFKKLDILYGEFLASGDRNLVVIGDRLSDSIFNTGNSIGRPFFLYGVEYTVKGVIKNSNSIYIPYHRRLLNDNWDVTLIKVEPSLEGGFREQHRRISNLIHSIEERSFVVEDRILYSDVIYFYGNLALFFILFNILTIVKYIYKGMKNSIKVLWHDYTTARVYSLFNYIVLNRKTLLVEGLKLSAGVLLIYSIYKIVPNVYINKDYFPNNIFSITSYYQVINNYYNIWIFRLRNGLTPIMIDFVKVNFAITVSAFVLFLTNKKHDRNKPLCGDHTSRDHNELHNYPS